MLIALLHKWRNYRKQRRMTQLYRQLLPKDALCFDIGANVGHRTVLFRQLGASVVSVEPVESSFKLLQKKFAQDNKVHLIQAAVSDTEGQATLFLSDVTEVCTLSQEFVRQYSHQEKHPLHWNKQTQVATTTLDTLIQKYGIPDFCKIDIEGQEYEAFKGLNHVLPSISFEFNKRLTNVALNCLSILAKNPDLLYNFSAYESGIFHFHSWQTNQKLQAFIQNPELQILTGDIYVRRRL